MKKHNFSAGPSILAQEVLDQAASAVLNFNNSNLSVLEVSHRGDDFNYVMNTAKLLVKELLNIPQEYEVLFLQGGASLQFYMSALNYMGTHNTGGYIDTGTWSSKAIKEANKTGRSITISSSKDKNYNYIPKDNYISTPIDYLHFTSNNTIYGTQFHKFPQKDNLKLPIICDMSSDIMSREFDITNFDLIYAGAQKNIGPAGTTLVIIKKDTINFNKLPSYLSYHNHIDKGSMFNTPPVFSIYVCMLTLEWLKNKGGIKTISEKNNAKANLMYQTIDNNPLFEGVVENEDRSIMNATFKLKEEHDGLKSQFETMCHESGIIGINGHRSVGGYRASMYNALEIESVDTLCQIMNYILKKS